MFKGLLDGVDVAWYLSLPEGIAELACMVLVNEIAEPFGDFLSGLRAGCRQILCGLMVSCSLLRLSSKHLDT